jgi:hypothetical protein
MLGNYELILQAVKPEYIHNCKLKCVQAMFLYFHTLTLIRIQASSVSYCTRQLLEAAAQQRDFTELHRDVVYVYNYSWCVLGNIYFSTATAGV